MRSPRSAPGPNADIASPLACRHPAGCKASRVAGSSSQTSKVLLLPRLDGAHGRNVPHATPLITIIVAGISLAFLFGAVASRLKISPLVAYILAGVVIGPATPGFTGNPALASELAEIGVIF